MKIRAIVSTTRHLPVLLACMLLPACSSDPGVAAQLDFTQAYTCPATRVMVTPVEGVSMAELMLGPGLGIAEDVRNDPQRLALWKQQHADMLGLYGYYKVFRVEGCGHTADYGCRCPSLGEPSHVGIKSKSIRTMCTCMQPPRSVSDVERERGQIPEMLP